MCKDFTRLKLTGEVYTDITDMSGTSMMDVGKAVYDDELLDGFGLTQFKKCLPEVRGPADVCGKVTAEAAALTGLAEGTPVAGGLFDVNACAIATGIIDDSKLCCIAGTWSINEYISKKPVVAEDHFMTSVYCMPEYYLIIDASATSASNLEWFVSNLLGNECSEGDNPYERCNEIVNDLGPAESDVVFLPFLYGSNAGPDASAGFLGLNGYHTKKHMLRAVYEGVAFGTKVHLDRLARFRQLPDTARVSGGAARSAVWMQMFADILGKKIEITANDELGTLGAALCAGVAVGAYSSFEDAVKEMIQIERSYEPNGKYSEIYNKKFNRYQQAVASLGSFWQPSDSPA